MNICTKFGFDILLIYGSYNGHRQRWHEVLCQRYGISSQYVYLKCSQSFTLGPKITAVAETERQSLGEQKQATPPKVEQGGSLVIGMQHVYLQ